MSECANDDEFFLEIHVFKFNETCCEEIGIPEECMGLCRERVERAEEIYPIDRCVQHQDHIASCIYEQRN